MAAARCESLTRAISVLERMAPTKYAGKWDNVGLLVDTLIPAAKTSPYIIFLTNDLTPAVMEEAQKQKANLVVTYHPTPFTAMKKFTAENVPSKIVLSAATSGIAVYSPHTAWDIATSGLNEWLVNGIATLAVNAGSSSSTSSTTSAVTSMRPLIPNMDHPDGLAGGIGDGRAVKLSTTVTLANVIQGVKELLGVAHVQVALPSSVAVSSSYSATSTAASVIAAAATVHIQSIAVCGGDGASMVSEAVSVTKAFSSTTNGGGGGVYVTGEMGHHDVLAATQAGIAIILTRHSACERPYIPVFASKLQQELKNLETAFHGEAGFELLISKVDADPLITV